MLTEMLLAENRSSAERIREDGLTALRAMMADRRLADPAKFGHIRQELGIDPVPDTDQPQE